MPLWSERPDEQVARQRRRARADDRSFRCAARCAARGRRGRGAAGRSASARRQCRRRFRRRLRRGIWPAPRRPRSPCPAPCAANGSMACAASPSSATAPSLQSPPSGTVNSAHLRQSSTAPSIIRAVAGQRTRRNAFLISVASPGALQPGRFQVPGTTATTLIWRAARNRIGDEMRVRPHPELDPAARCIRAATAWRRACRARRSGRRIAAAPRETDDAGPSTRCRRRRSAPSPVPAGASCRCAGPRSDPWRGGRRPRTGSRAAVRCRDCRRPAACSAACRSARCTTQ